MKNRIDLSKYNIRTDLLIESEGINNSNIKVKNINDNIKVTTTYVDDDLSKSLLRKIGTYITIEFEDITNYEDRVEVSNQLCIEIRNILNDLNIKDMDKCLIIGLGNANSTADSLGPKVVDKVLVTRHLFELNTLVKEGIRCVSAISPGVMASTGIETLDIIHSLVAKIKPDFIIVIDSLASLSIDRLNKTIQITDTGINPGSGVGNNRKEISKDNLGIPVIAVGVPTVVYSSIIVNDTINYLFKHISYIKNNYDMNKLIFTRKDYSKKLKDNDLSIEEKEELSGIIGTLDDDDKISLINEVLNGVNYNLIVTPKEIDFLVDKLSMVIGNGINKSLHREVSDDNLL